MAVADQIFSQGHGSRRLHLHAYTPGDEADLDLRDDFAAAWDASGHALPPGLRWTVVDANSDPLAIGGLELLRPHVFGAWGLAARLDPRGWAFVRRAAGKVLAYAERELAAREILATAKATPQAVDLLKSLGFATYGDTWEGPDGASYVPMLRSF